MIFEEKVHHLIIDSNEGLATWFRSSNYPGKSLRTSLSYCDFTNSDVDAIISSCNHLRAFDLSFSITQTLPDKFDKLLHLRYLDLSNNDELEMLPKSIAKLHNLQTLKLFKCRQLKELSHDTNKLVNLRVLDIDECGSLLYMPAGMNKLIYLHTLPLFLLYDFDELRHIKKGKVIELMTLFNSLRGFIKVHHNSGNLNFSKLDIMHATLQSLKLICILVSGHKEGHESALESLLFSNQFHEMKVENYGGTMLPSLTPRLMSIELERCDELQYIPSSLSQLCHLKYFKLKELKNVEFIKYDAPSSSAIFFPSLEKLEIREMQKLKGLWMEDVVFVPSFSKLLFLKISYCNRLTYFVSEALTFCMGGGGVQSIPISLKRLRINNSYIFNSLFRECVGSVDRIELSDIENLGALREGLQKLWHFCSKPCDWVL
ncbi:putative disease resistance protein RGA3 [Chenopodium quinoa]|uniref:putative disease resistance protein RGA3 n=1 Tax=Chenopodium quinoa TaxID=63459 RepID=UPI000B780270|nr:putative disease resistance protein RGA3 [Chenopodium quinoa]